MEESINIKQEIRWGDWYFKDHVIPSDFDYRARKKECSEYYRKRGFFASMMYSDYYSRLNGIESDRYMPMDIYFFYALPCLNRWDLRLAYTDKNLYSTLFPQVAQAKTVIKNINGVFFDGNGRIVDAPEAESICANVTGDCIIKPTLDTCNGDGVRLFHGGDVDSIHTEFGKYGVNFIVQKKIAQHADMARINASSLNTLRIFTYRDVGKKVHYLYSFLRFGGSGSVVDNASSGGGFCKIVDGGRVDDRVYQYKNLEIRSLMAERGVCDFMVPSYNKLIETAIQLHGVLPYFDYIGWDLAVGADGSPVLVEFNVLANIGTIQVVHGPVFGSFLDEVMDRVGCVTKEHKVYSRNVFRPGFDYLLPIG